VPEVLEGIAEEERKRGEKRENGKREDRKIEEYNKNYFTNWCLRSSKTPLKKRENELREEY